MKSTYLVIGIIIVIGLYMVNGSSKEVKKESSGMASYSTLELCESARAVYSDNLCVGRCVQVTDDIDTCIFGQAPVLTSKYSFYHSDVYTCLEADQLAKSYHCLYGGQPSSETCSTSGCCISDDIFPTIITKWKSQEGC